MRRHHGIAAVAVSGVIVAVHQVWTQPFPPPELGVGPEMFNWRLGWFGLVFSFLFAILVLAVAIGLAIRMMRGIEARRQRTHPPSRNRTVRRSAWTSGP